jgi:UDP-N-acetylmuramoyl-L-alanyl-D-glutamate--2,6-diaminopimelate ligase
LCAEILDKYADEIILTTDDPGQDDPRKIAATVREKINRKEGDQFFEIEDRYEAIRYAIYTAQSEDLVLIAGRGTEKTQIIRNTAIHFDDREVAREVLSFALGNKLLEKK